MFFEPQNINGRGIQSTPKAMAASVEAKEQANFHGDVGRRKTTNWFDIYIYILRVP